ncbi:helix-turn-helix transcriptional regulator [Salmonella enterica subsp. enterica]|nr:helix-turn-helix transcriptional regulator [Salmonella enterica subsp. enterica serovar Glostrup]
MANNISVIVLTPCHFLFSGLKNLLRDNQLQLQFLHASTVDEVQKLQTIPGVSMIMVASESFTPVERSRALVLVRHLDWLMLSGAMPRIPCLLLMSDMSISVSGKIFWLTRGQAGYDLELLLGSILAHMDLYQEISAWSPLSEQQKIILKGTLSGLKVEELAVQMNILPRTVFVHRDVLIKKLGLRNRLELMCLNINNFSDIYDKGNISPHSLIYN